MRFAHQTQKFQGMFLVIHCVFILINKQGGSQDIQTAVGCSFIDAKLDIEFSNNVLGTLLDFYFDQQKGEMPETLRKLKLFFFVFDCTIIDVKLMLR